MFAVRLHPEFALGLTMGGWGGAAVADGLMAGKGNIPYLLEW